jgi:perosamine synthetase
MGVFAFYPNKQITTGEGGVVVTRDEALARRIRALRNQGRYESDDWFQHSELGYNYRISEINCALGLAQMSRLEEILRKREAVASAYHQRLAQYQELVLPPPAVAAGRISWFVYVVRLGLGPYHDREVVMRGLAAAGIASGRYFAPIHLQPSYAAWRTSANLPVTEAESARTLALPFFNNLREETIDEVCDTLGLLLLPRQAP